MKLEVGEYYELDVGEEHHIALFTPIKIMGKDMVALVFNEFKDRMWDISINWYSEISDLRCTVMGQKDWDWWELKPFELRQAFITLFTETK